MEKGLKIVTIGGGSSYTPEFIEGFIKRKASLPVKEIWLVDIPAGQAKLDIVGQLAQRMVQQAGLDIVVKTTTDRREALAGADFVTTQLRVGGLAARIRDERIPLEFDCIGQETTGAGGFANALRTVPVILDICRDIEELCPQAWMINFANPSGIVTEAILNHTAVKAIGLCNVPISLQNDMAEKYHVPVTDVYCDFIGLNHLLWAQKILIENVDKTAEIVADANSREEIMENIPDVAFGEDFYRSLGMLPVSYLKYYYLAKEMLAECQYAAAHQGVRGEVVQAVESELFDLYKDPQLKVKPPQLSQRGGAHYSDVACNLIDSIYNDKQDIQVVNVKNNGATCDLPDQAVIERNCVIGKDGAKPLPIGPLPLKVRGLIQIVKAYEQLTVQAAVNGDRDAGLQALAIHPLVPSISVAKPLLDKIIQENWDFLPNFH